LVALPGIQLRALLSREGPGKKSGEISQTRFSSTSIPAFDPVDHNTIELSREFEHRIMAGFLEKMERVIGDCLADVLPKEGWLLWFGKSP
jgi:hypothetical protein